MLEFGDLTGQVIGYAIEVHSQLGPGLLESVYKKCLVYELEKAGLAVEVEKTLPITYKDVQLDCGYRIDILVENKLILELKAVEKVLGVHEAQVITYMKLANIPTGLLLNFNAKLLKDGLKRFVLKQ